MAARHAGLLEVEDLVVWLRGRSGPVRAVDGVSFSLAAGQTLGVVGESGSGKSMLMRSILGLVPDGAVVRRDGRVHLDGHDISRPITARRLAGSDMAIVMQDPMTSLNPVVRVGRQITEVLTKKLGMSRRLAQVRAVELLASVGIPEPKRRLRQHPHELSGGMRQRVAIAMAVAASPSLLIADEPTTALDVTVQAQILDLLDDQQRDRAMSMILVSHDLAVVAGRAHRVLVMYAGQVVEDAPAASIFECSRMPYTRALLDAAPRLGSAPHTHLRAIPGQPVDLSRLPEGCRFSQRCPYAQQRCRDEAPPLTTDPADPSHAFRCWFPVGIGR